MNAIDLQGRNAVVTGAAAGIGYAIAARLIASGANVCLWDVAHDGAKDAAAALAKAGGEDQVAFAALCDIADGEAVSRALDHTRQRFDVIDILVNNAGITGPNAPVWEYPIEDWRTVIDVDLTGPFLVSRAVVPVMLENGYGRIVNIASVAGKDGNPNAAAYSAAKAGLIALTKSLGKELAQSGILVNCVTPAAVKTALFEQMTEAHIAFMLSKIPMGRFGEPEEIASLVAWLCSKECSFSTGGIFDLSGGRASY